MSNGTLIFTKKKYLAWIEKNMEEDELLVMTNKSHGTAYAPSKKLQVFRVPFAFSGEAFKAEGLSVFMRNFAFGGVMVKKDDINPDAISKIQS